MIKLTKIDFGPHYSAVCEYIEAAKASCGMTIAGALGQLLLRAVQHDLLNVGGKFSAKASERRAARRAERKAAEAASPAKPQEPQADDDGERVWRTGEEWTSSDDYKAVSAAVKAVWDKADMEGRERINRMWSDVREDEQAACDFLRGLQKAG